MGIGGIIYFLLIESLVVSACKAPEPKVFPRPALTTVMVGREGYSYNIRTERFVVANPPRSEPEIRALIDAYIHGESPADRPEKHTMIVRFFYRETEFTPRDYTESIKSYFDHDRIEDHDSDLLVTVTWTRGRDGLDYIFPSSRASP